MKFKRFDAFKDERTACYLQGLLDARNELGQAVGDLLWENSGQLLQQDQDAGSGLQALLLQLPGSGFADVLAVFPQHGNWGVRRVAIKAAGRVCDLTPPQMVSVTNGQRLAHLLYQIQHGMRRIGPSLPGQALLLACQQKVHLPAP